MHKGLSSENAFEFAPDGPAPVVQREPSCILRVYQPAVGRTHPLLCAHLNSRCLCATCSYIVLLVRLPLNVWCACKRCVLLKRSVYTQQYIQPYSRRVNWCTSCAHARMQFICCWMRPQVQRAVTAWRHREVIIPSLTRKALNSVQLKPREVLLDPIETFLVDYLLLLFLILFYHAAKLFKKLLFPVRMQAASSAYFLVEHALKSIILIICRMQGDI